MGRQFRAPRRGGSGVPSAARPYIGPATVTSSSVNTVIPNYGVTDMSTWAAGEYVLDAPAEGVLKTFVCASTGTSATKSIRLSPSTANNVTITYGTPTTGASGNTQINFASTLDCCLTMMGQNSTHWFLVSVHPALNSTGTSVLST